MSSHRTLTLVSSGFRRVYRITTVAGLSHKAHLPSILMERRYATLAGMTALTGHLTFGVP